MGQQVKDEFYKDAEAMCMDYAAAVNEEAHELVKAGADVIQLDEPWLRNNPEEAKRYAVKVINRALQGITVPTVVHLCFGYAAVVTGGKPTGYAFLPQLADSIAQQISIESAQPKLDLGVLKDLAPKKVMLGVIDLNDPEIETPQKVADRIRAGLKYHVARQAPARARLRHEVPAAGDGVREAEVVGRRRGDRAQGTRLSLAGARHSSGAILLPQQRRATGVARQPQRAVTSPCGLTVTDFLTLPCVALATHCPSDRAAGRGRPCSAAPGDASSRRRFPSCRRERIWSARRLRPRNQPRPEREEPGSPCRSIGQSYPRRRSRTSL